MTRSPESPELKLPPLTLYVHLPWCVRKCPYCDFNSHAVQKEMPADEYVAALFRDLEHDLPLVWGRTVQSVFFGGGTPSLFTASQVERMISGFRQRLNVAPGAEITLEANPGTTERDSFSAYRDAGVNRFSLGVQSFDEDMLDAIGRIHGRREIHRALDSIGRSGIENFNLDLMFGLPGQGVETAVEDIALALETAPSHLSHYQLTVEPNTAFHAAPPALPPEDTVWEMQERCAALMRAAGMSQYEISAWSRPGMECRHNMNYWQYGDFLGIGAGAHGKITLPAAGEIRRRIRLRHPRVWMDVAGSEGGLAEDRAVPPNERIFEFFLNQLRQRGGVRKSMFTPRTGLDWKIVEDRVSSAVEKGLLEDRGELLIPGRIGWRFVNDIQALFLP